MTRMQFIDVVRVLAGAAVMASCASVLFEAADLRPSARAAVVIVIRDPAGSVDFQVEDASGTPILRSLLDESVYFEHASAIAATPAPNITALLSGREIRQPGFLAEFRSWSHGKATRIDHAFDEFSLCANPPRLVNYTFEPEHIETREIRLLPIADWLDPAVNWTGGLLVIDFDAREYDPASVLTQLRSYLGRVGAWSRMIVAIVDLRCPSDSIDPLDPKAYSMPTLVKFPEGVQRRGVSSIPIGPIEIGESVSAHLARKRRGCVLEDLLADELHQTHRYVYGGDYERGIYFVRTGRWQFSVRNKGKLTGGSSEILLDRSSTNAPATDLSHSRVEIVEPLHAALLRWRAANGDALLSRTEESPLKIVYHGLVTLVPRTAIDLPRPIYK